MTSFVQGGCLCGHVRYEYVGVVGPANYCHCQDCRRCTGSAFNIGVRLDREAFRLVSGELAGFSKRGESGNELTRHFCPRCGSPIYTSAPRHPEHVYVKAGSFDDPEIVEPTHESWTRSAVSWHHIDADIAHFEKGRS